MFKQLLKNVHVADDYLIISLLIFIIFFISLIIWLYRLDNRYTSEMRKKPLE